MSWRDWFNGLLERLQRPAPAPETGDRRLAFLSEIAGAESEAVSDYRLLSEDRDAAFEEIDDFEAVENDQEVLLDTVLMHVLSKHDIVTMIDWSEDAEGLIDGVSFDLDARGASPLTEAERKEILAFVQEQRPRRGENIGYAFGPLAEKLEERGFALLDINEGSDCYYFVAAPSLFERWAGVDLSAGLRVENPAWQFEKQLAGLPYARFHRP